MEANSEAYSEPCQISKIEAFAQIVNGFQFLTILAKSSILNVWQGYEFASEARKVFISDLSQNFEFAFVAIIFAKLLANLFAKFD